MEAMGLIAIMVNCYLIGQCGQLQRLFPWLSPEMVIISIVVLEVKRSQPFCLHSVTPSRSMPQLQTTIVEIVVLFIYYLYQNQGHCT